MDKILKNDISYLTLLSEQYPNTDSVCAEVIKLRAILTLPKGTEHFVSDIHGEFDAFNHVLRNASGVIKSLIEEIFGASMREAEKRTLATLIYYPEKKLEIIKDTEEDIDDWYKTTLSRLVKICKAVSVKYTRSKVSEAIPQELSYIIDELLNEDKRDEEKKNYYEEFTNSVIALQQADRFIVALCYLIQRFAIDHLHVIGDIFDRGPDAVKIIDMLMNYHSLDIQWGNHDMSWMGAAAGCEALICNVIRFQARYGNLATLEEDYGINLVPLATFAMETYKDDPCTQFIPKQADEGERETALTAKMHKAISVLQFKYEAAIIKRHPEFKLEKRLLLDNINLEKKIFTVEGQEYALNDTSFPTINADSPDLLTPDEAEMMAKVKFSFTHNEKLQKHIRFLLRKGSMYKVYNGNLLYHGIIPLNEDGTLREVMYRGKILSGKKYLDEVDKTVRQAYYEKAKSKKKTDCLDHVWFLWTHEDSPLFGKKNMTTFERYFTDDERAHFEGRDPYYQGRNDVGVCERILADFGLNPETSRIINGHVPVHAKNGESPIKSHGKLFVIDGGFAKAYQGVTGIAGYTLIYNPHGLLLVSHQPFTSVEEAVVEETDIVSSTVAMMYSNNKILVADTDAGSEIKKKIFDLEELLYAYNNGFVKEIL